MVDFKAKFYLFCSKNLEIANTSSLNG